MGRALKRLLGAVAAIALTGIACLCWGLQTPWFSSAAGRWLSGQTGRPIAVGRIVLEVYPRPAILLEQLSLKASSGYPGKGDIRNARLIPGVSWMPGLIPRSRLEVGSLQLDESLLHDLIDHFSGKQGGGGVWLPFSDLSVSSLSVRGDRRHHPAGYRLHARLQADGAIARAELQRLDDHMRLTYAPVGDGSRSLLALVARDWVPPVGPAFHFRRASLSAYLSDKGLDVYHVNAEALTGRLDGKVRIGWGRNWSVDGKLEGDGLRMAPVIEYYGGKGFDGLLSARVSIRTKAGDPHRLLDGIKVEGPFVIRKAVIDTGRGAAKRLHIDTIHARGRVDRWSFRTVDTLVEAYGGEARGVTETRWSGSPSITGKVKVRGVELAPVLDALMERRPLSGRLSGDGGFVLSAPTFSGIFGQPDLAANLRVDKGVVFETDLEKLQEGQTPFSELKTRVRMKEGVTLLSSVDIQSDRLSAEGWVKVDRDRRLDGKIAVTLQNTISLAGANVGVGGTVDDPSFVPATSTIIGGVIGTGLLGPGWGTALGVRLGQLLDSVSSDDSEVDESSSAETRGRFKRTSTRR